MCVGTPAECRCAPCAKAAPAAAAGADRLTLVLRAGHAARQQEQPCDGKLGDALQKLAKPNQAKREKLSAEIADIERRMNKFDDEWEEQIQKLEEWNNLIQLRAAAAVHQSQRGAGQGGGR